MQKTVTGLSLLETLVCLGLIAFILLKALTPDFAASRRSKEVDAMMRELITLVAMARSQAINEGVMVTICRSTDGQSCQGAWREGAIAFTDRNANRVLDDDDRLLYRMDPVKVSGALSFNSFQNRQYLQLTPRGFANYQNGNFTYCPANGDAALARQIIVSLTGRTRFARDQNGDGTVEDSQGRPLQCK